MISYVCTVWYIIYYTKYTALVCTILRDVTISIVSTFLAGEAADSRCHTKGRKKQMP